MSKFAVSPATLEDLPDLATVSRAAYRDSPHTMTYWMFPQKNEKAIYEWRLRGITNIHKNVSGCSYTKCIDMSTKKIVAFALWETPHSSKAKKEELTKEEEKGSTEKDAKTDSELPEGTNVKLMNAFNEEVERMRKKYVDREKDYVLWVLATLPEYQGRGCGTLLLKSELEKVDAEGRKAWLEATPQGQHLYEKYGWTYVDEIVVDLNKYGCAQKVQKTTCMMRGVSV